MQTVDVRTWFPYANGYCFTKAGSLNIDTRRMSFLLQACMYTYLQDNNLDKDEVTFTGYYVPPELPELELSGFDYHLSSG